MSMLDSFDDFNSDASLECHLLEPTAIDVEAIRRDYQKGVDPDEQEDAARDFDRVMLSMLATDWFAAELRAGRQQCCMLCNHGRWSADDSHTISNRPKAFAIIVKDFTLRRATGANPPGMTVETICTRCVRRYGTATLDRVIAKLKQRWPFLKAHRPSHPGNNTKN